MFMKRKILGPPVTGWYSYYENFIDSCCLILAMKHNTKPPTKLDEVLKGRQERLKARMDAERIDITVELNNA